MYKVARQLALVLLIGLIFAGTAQAQLTIRQGVTAGGVDLSGLTKDEAAIKLADQLRSRMDSPLLIRVGAKRFQLKPRTVGFRFYALRSAADALLAQSSGEVGLAVAISKRKLGRYINELAVKTDTKTKYGKVKITVNHISMSKGKGALRLKRKQLSGSIVRVLTNPNLSREVVAHRRRVYSKSAQIPPKYHTILTIDRHNFKLRLFKHLRLRKTYQVAIGKAGYQTPAGLFSITSKQINPAWHAPSWAPNAGEVVPGGVSNNPLKARWLGIKDGIGIHGTSEPWSIGSAASHGCIRMHVNDVIALYRKVPLGTPVLIR